MTAIRLEYGRVEKGFTTRTSAWDRDELKDSHDDMNLIEYLHVDKFTPEQLVEAIKSNLGTLISFVKPDTEAKKQLQSACESIVDSLTTNAATSTEINYSPLVLNMQTTNAYRNKSELVNTASVVAYRNGGGKDLQLEGEDSDKVVQVPTADSDVAEDFLAQTGRDVAGIASIGIIAAGIAFAIRRKKIA